MQLYFSWRFWIRLFFYINCLKYSKVIAWLDIPKLAYLLTMALVVRCNYMRCVHTSIYSIYKVLNEHPKCVFGVSPGIVSPSRVRKPLWESLHSKFFLGKQGQFFKTAAKTQRQNEYNNIEIECFFEHCLTTKKKALIDESFTLWLTNNLKYF